MENREIKFRAFYDNRMHNNEEAMRILYNNSTESTLTPKYPIMQYTGLKDRNGKEIYEGDIITFHKGYVDDSWTDGEQGQPYLIEWRNCGFKAFRENMELIIGAGQEGKYKWVWEVIGNRFENPELLKT